MKGTVRVQGGLLELQPGGPINGMYRFVPDNEGATWTGRFSEDPAAAPKPKPKILKAPKAAAAPAAASADKPKPNVKSDPPASAVGTVCAAQNRNAATKPARGGVKKRTANGDYKKKRRPPASEETLAKRRAAAKAAALTRSLQPKKKKMWHRLQAKMMDKTSGRGRFMWVYS